MATDNIEIRIQAKVDQAIKGLAKTKSQTDKLARSNGGLTKSLSGLRVGYAAVAGVLTGVVAQALGKSVKAFQSFQQASQATEKQFGKDADQIIKKLRDVSKGTVSNTDLIVSANKAMALNVTQDLGTMADLMEVARVRGQALGLDTTQAFNDIVTGIGRGSPLILDNLGIITKGWDKEAKAAGVAFDAQFILNKVLADGADLLKRTGEVAITGAERIQALGATFDNLSVSLGGEISKQLAAFQESLGTGVDTTGIENSLKRVIKVFGGILSVAAQNVRILANLFFTPFQVFFAIIKSVQDSIVNLGQVMKKVATGDIAGALDIIKKTGTDAAGAVKDVFVQNTEDIKNSVLAMKDAIFGAFDSLEKKAASTNLTPKIGGDPTDSSNNEFQEATDKKLTISNAGEEKIRNDLKQTAQVARQALSDTFDIQSQFIQNDIDREENAKQKKQDVLEDQFAKGLISQEQFEQGKIDIERQSDSKIRELKIKQFKAKKKASIIESIINTALGISAQASLVFPLNVIAGALVAATGAAQTAAIAAQPIPAFQTGGEFTTNGPQLIQVGDNPSGRERVTIEPEGGSVTNNTSNDNRNINISVESNNGIELVNDLKRTYGIDVFS